MIVAYVEERVILKSGVSAKALYLLQNWFCWYCAKDGLDAEVTFNVDLY